MNSDENSGEKWHRRLGRRLRHHRVVVSSVSDKTHMDLEQFIAVRVMLCALQF